jgi:hypothetical protein
MSARSRRETVTSALPIRIKAIDRRLLREPGDMA